MGDELVATIAETHIQKTKWVRFQAGQRYKQEATPSVNSRCYFQFEAMEQAEEFIKDYHGHKFVDGHGEEFRAVACFAPYQKVPRQRPQKDARDGTIEDDATYQEFVASLAEKGSYEAPPNPIASLKPASYADTPLLNYMKQRAKDRRERFEKQKKKWKPSADTIDEYSAKAKWYCTECGTTKNLEEDPDNRGTFYCTYCWESWEAQEAAAPKKKKKAKEEAAYEEVEEVEETSSKKKKKKKKDT